MLSALFVLSLASCGVRAELIDSSISQWFWGSSLVVGDYLYITGGEYYTTAGAAEQTQTFIVDMTTSWTNQSVILTANIDQPTSMRTLRQPQLYYDEGENTIRRYGGWPYAGNESIAVAMPSEIWSTPAGVQSTSWTLDVSPADGGLSSDTLGPFAPATAFSDSKFYSFGGNVFKPDALPNMTVLSGLVTQDLESDRWENFTASVPAQSPYRTQAKALIVPNFGEQGYFVVVGGENPPTEESFYELGTFMADMSVITMYDIASGTWYSQKTTGDIPPPRSEFCIVGAASSDGSSFEMFVYGGSTNSTYDLAHPGEDGYLSVYALSFPGFQWFKTTSKTTKRRACHTCSVVGKRQFISIGGRQPSSRQAFGQEPDPWVSGIGIFDMTEFAWADTYTADAAAYESPEVVKDYYAASYKEPEWSDNSLAAAFAFTPPPSSTTTGGSSSPTGSNSAPTSGSTESESKRSNTGPIAGGVVGGVAGLAVIVGLGYWLGRRRRVQIEPSPPAEAGSSQDFKAPPVYGSVASMPLSLGPQSNSAVYEAPTSKPRAELASAPQKYESHFVELPVDARN